MLAHARKNKEVIPYHCFIYYFSCTLFVQIEKAVSLRLVICPPGRRSAAAAPAARQPTLPRPPTLKAAKLAFLPAPPHAARMRLRLQSRQLGSSPLGTFAAQGTSALTATHRRDCGRRSRPQTRSTSRTNGMPSAPVCFRPAPCPRTFKGERSR